MDRVNASDIAAQEFPVVRKGYDPEAVRAFLVELSTSPLVTSTPDVIEAAARARADAIEAAARAEAEQIEAAARAEAQQILDDAEQTAAAHREQAELYRSGQEALAARSIDEAEHRLREAEARATKTLDDAERTARERSDAILETARLRLHRLLDAEREVHIRLSAAFSSVDAPTELPLERNDEALLDLAFAEFFSSDIEHDESRAWILSDHAG